MGVVEDGDLGHGAARLPAGAVHGYMVGMRTLVARLAVSLVTLTTVACGDDTGGGGSGGGTGGADATTGGDTTATGTGGAGSGGEGTGGDGGAPAEVCNFGDTTPADGMATIRLQLTGVGDLTAPEATWQVREAGSATYLTRATSTLGGGDAFCPAWLLADASTSYEVDVWIDEDGDFACTEPPADVVLTAPVPAFVDDQATVVIAFDGTSNGTCTPFL